MLNKQVQFLNQSGCVILFFKYVMRFAVFILAVSFLAACAIAPPGTPSGGGSGSPPTPSMPQPPSSGGQSGQESSQGKSEQSGREGGEQGKNKSDDPSQNGDSGGAGEENTPSEWENGEQTLGGAQGSGEGEAGEEADATFEESDGGGDFEQPTFDDSDGLSQEELDELERELEETLSDFDEDMQREQTYAEERANEATADDNLGGIGTFENYEEEFNGSRSGRSSNSSQSRPGEGAEQGDGRQGSQGAKGESTTTSSEHEGRESGSGGEGQEEKTIRDDIPRGHDDDIVARQIREAAEQESDPVLRERLWEEYRNYKNQ